MDSRFAVTFVLAAVVTTMPAAAQQDPAPAVAAKPARPLAEEVVATITSGENQAVTALIMRLRKGTKEERAAFGQLLERLQPVAKALPAAGRGAPDPKVLTAPLPDATRQLVADLFGADAEKTKAAQEALTAAAEDDVEVQKLVDRAGTLLAGCMLRWFQEQLESRALFAGQHAPLADYGPPALQLLQQWISKPPPRVSAEAIKTTSIRALRDCVAGEPAPALLEQLRKTAADVIESREVRKEAGFALAQFGDRSFVDARIKELEGQAQAKSESARGQALADLADLFYNIRDYAKAAELHKRHLELIESSEAVRKAQRNLPTIYYNACCSMALAGQIDDAFAHLEKAIEVGKQGGEALPRRLLEVDMDIVALRADPRFAKLLAKLDGK